MLPYLEEDFWKAFPKANAAEFARFVSMVKKGHPLMQSMVVKDPPGPQAPEYEAALKLQQQRDKEVLGVGARRRS